MTVKKLERLLNIRRLIQNSMYRAQPLTRKLVILKRPAVSERSESNGEMSESMPCN
jgi:hypothetical protein